MERLSEQAPELLYIRNGHCYLEQKCKHHSHQAAASLCHGFIPFSYRKVSGGLIRQQKDEACSYIRFQYRLLYQKGYLAKRSSRPHTNSNNRLWLLCLIFDTTPSACVCVQSVVDKTIFSICEYRYAWKPLVKVARPTVILQELDTLEIIGNLVITECSIAQTMTMISQSPMSLKTLPRLTTLVCGSSLNSCPHIATH